MSRADSSISDTELAQVADNEADVRVAVERSAVPLRIAIISDWFAEKMGYAENCLPKALAALGHDVHLITSNAQIYFDSPTYKETYEPFIGPPVVECQTKQLDGYTLHRLPYGKVRGKLWQNRLYIQQLTGRLSAIRPQIVQTFEVPNLTTYQTAVVKPLLGYKLFLESHIHASVFTASRRSRGFWNRFERFNDNMLRRLVAATAVKCYPISIDAAEIAIEHLGVPERKIEVCSLGVDTDLFHPVNDDNSRRTRNELRTSLGFAESDIVCVYSGRFTSDKGAVVLARAIDKLVSQGKPYRGLFVGNGTAEDVATIQNCAGCVVHPFVPVRDLPPYYWVADIGVWPKQESTSQLDAAACGLPLILSDRIQVRERVNGNGLMYVEENVDDLAAKIDLLDSPSLRKQMGKIGSARVSEQFSWRNIARLRAQDYARSLRL